jgi:thiol-disulfide isomerase/thioredoxin
MNPERPIGRRTLRLTLGPSRAAFSKQTRRSLALMLAALVVVVLVVGAVLAGSKSHSPIRTVTIPAADRSAPPSLLRAAESVGFEPVGEPGAGEVESRPLSEVPPSATGLLAPGMQAPAFTLETPPGPKVSLASLRGKVVLLEFFATWCPHCAAEAPHLKTIYAALPHSRYAFVAVNADSETAPSVLAYHIYFGFPFPAVLDPGGKSGSFHHHGSRGTVSLAYRVPSYPTFYVLDGKGRVAWAGTGEQPDGVLSAELHRAAAAG